MQEYLIVILIFFSGISSEMMALSYSDSLRTEKRQGKVFIIHQIDSGESIASIAKRYKVEIDVLLAANPKIKSARLRNQLLNVPVVKPIDEGKIKTYRVKQGETVYSMSKKFLTSEERIIELNQLKNPNDIKAGSVIKVEISPRKPKKTTYASWVYEPQKEIPVYHLVREKETIFSLASLYGTKQDSIKIWNKLKSNKILVGQKLLVAFAKSDYEYEKWMGIQSKNTEIQETKKEEIQETNIKIDSVFTQKDSSSAYVKNTVGDTLSVASRKIEVLDNKKDTLLNVSTKDSVFEKIAQAPKIDSLSELTQILEGKINESSQDITKNEEKKKQGVENSKEDFVRQEGVAQMVLGGKNDPQKPLALYSNTSIGSFVKVINPLNGKSISVRVIGKMTDEKDTGILIKLSKYACEQLEAKDEQFKVVIEYQKEE